MMKCSTELGSPSSPSVAGRRFSLPAVCAHGTPALLALLLVWQPALAAAALGVALVTPLYRYVARRSSPLLAALLPATCSSLLLPKSVAACADIVLVGLILLYALRAFRDPDTVGAGIVAACLVLIGYWALLTFNRNVPSLSVALLGLRKSVFVFLGLVLGISWPARTRDRARDLICALLLCLAIVCIAIHFVFPQLEASLPRAAGASTGVLAGRSRMQGILPGPFHIALLGSFLVIQGWQGLLFRTTRRLLAVSTLSIGCLTVALAEVRTAYVVLLVVLPIVTIFGRTTAGRRRLGKALLLLAGFTVLIAVSPLSADPAFRSVPSLTSDTRALGRVDTWKESIGLLRSSPLYGWGPGSAGDTLDAQFSGRRHVTAHSILLKYGVEGGLIGLSLAALVCVRLLTGRERLNLRDPAASALLLLLAFGLTGSSVEALPVSFLLCVLAGAGVAAPESSARSPAQVPETALVPD